MIDRSHSFTHIKVQVSAWMDDSGFALFAKQEDEGNSLVMVTLPICEIDFASLGSMLAQAVKAACDESAKKIAAQLIRETEQAVEE